MADPSNVVISQCWAGQVEIRHLGGARSLLEGPQTCNALFGYGLGVADFNGDGTDDLVVGAPGVTVVKAERAGPLWLYAGGPEGLTKPITTIDQSLPTDGYADGPATSNAGWQFKYFLPLSDYQEGEGLGAAIAG